MKILLTNDDGVGAAGLLALARVFAPDHKIIVAAPDRERSTVSHSLTLHKPLRVKQRKDLGNFPIYEISGMPADCVKIGMRVLYKNEKPDLVISGMNYGPNLGTDVVYSGTVSAAREAVIEGVPGIAISIASKAKDVDFDAAAVLVKDIVQMLKAKFWSSSMLLNINIPFMRRKLTLNDLMITHLGERKYDNLLDERKDPAGNTYYWMHGEVVDEDKNALESDVGCVLAGKVSVTPLHYDYTDQKQLLEMRAKLYYAVESPKAVK